MDAQTTPTVTIVPPDVVPSSWLQRHPQTTALQRSAAAAARFEKQKRVEADIEAWYNESLVLAARMSEDYGMPQSHFMRQMFQAGAKIVNARKPNAYNAWLRRRANELNEGESQDFS